MLTAQTGVQIDALSSLSDWPLSTEFLPEWKCEVALEVDLALVWNRALGWMDRK